MSKSLLPVVVSRKQSRIMKPIPDNLQPHYDNESGQDSFHNLYLLVVSVSFQPAVCRSQLKH